MERLLCFLSARNLGDAVFHAEFLRVLVRSDVAERFVVWTFPAARFLFERIDRCEVVVSAFPMGASMRGFLPRGVPSFVAAVRRLRRMRPTATLELVADHRERAAARLVGAPRHLEVAWAPGHPFRRHNRIGAPAAGGVDVPARIGNLYAAYDLVLRALVGRSAPVFDGSPVPRRGPSRGAIGIHPFASQACKLWPVASWVALLERLRRDRPDREIVLFGAPSDAEALARLAASAAGPVSVFASSLSAFRDRVAELETLVGLDSFSVHVAHASGVPSVLLVGANDPRTFSPPSSRAVYRPSRCPHQPCGNRPRCEGTDFQYACMSAIGPDDVLEALAGPPPAPPARAARAQAPSDPIHPPDIR